MRRVFILAIFLAIGIAGAGKGLFRPARPHAAALLCLGEGREGSARAWEQQVCCEGLRTLRKSVRARSGWWCGVPEEDEDKIVCAACGDGVCGKGETSCNCGKDCRIPWTCGNGRIDKGEQCDDRNRRIGDGCSERCTLEEGWRCGGTPSTCSSKCGDGVVTADEQCDDGNRKDADGCTSQCVVEAGWSCEGAPSRCTADGVVQASAFASCLGREDGSVVLLADGCTACSCRGGGAWTCTRLTCMPNLSSCGNGILEADRSEWCDDGNRAEGDGCNPYCRTEIGWWCEGSPSACTLR